MPRLSNDRFARLSIPITAAILVSALLVRLVGIEHRWLWSDELLSVTFVAHGLWNTLITTLRFDIHPPLYYLQLALWASVSKSDLWLMLNSVAWSVAAVGLLTAATRHFYGPRTALVAGALFAFSPAALMYCDQVRMYSFLTVLIVWVWVAQRNWLLKAVERRPISIGLSLSLVFSQLAVVYTHSAGLIMISGCVLFSAATLVTRRDLHAAKRWLLCEFIVGVCSLPAIAISLLRDVKHTSAPTLADVWLTWKFLSAGVLEFTSFGFALAVVVLALLVYVFAVKPRERVSILTLIFAPMLVAAVVSYTIKPIWLDRTFVTVIPFLCLYIAIAIEQKMTLSVGGVILLIFGMAWTGTGIAGQLVRDKGDGYKPTASELRSIVTPRDIVIVDGDYMYWCFLWYFSGPNWGVPQQAYIETPKWSEFVSHLNSNIATALDFRAQDRRVMVGGTPVLLWDRDKPVDLPPSERIFVLRDVYSAPLKVPGYHLQASDSRMGLVMDQWQKDTKEN